MEHHKEDEGPVQLGQTKGAKMKFWDVPPDAKIRFLPTENYGWPMVVSLEEAKRMAEPIRDCPLCDAGIPLKGKKNA